MKVHEMDLPGVLLIEADVYRDHRGSFMETWQEERYRMMGIDRSFTQDNVSTSRRDVIRGLHYQHPHPQEKLVTVLHGAVFDVAVDVRRGSSTFGRWIGHELTSDSGQQLLIPEGFAHGFAVLSDVAVFAYKCTAPYRHEAEATVLWNDPELAIRWPIADPVLSEKDLRGVPLSDIPPQRLPCVRDEPRG